MGAIPNAIIIVALCIPERETPRLMQATCFMAANDTMAFKLNRDSIAKFYSCRHHGDFVVSVLQPQRIA